MIIILYMFYVIFSKIVRSDMVWTGRLQEIEGEYIFISLVIHTNAKAQQFLHQNTDLTKILTHILNIRE